MLRRLGITLLMVVGVLAGFQIGTIIAPRFNEEAVAQQVVAGFVGESATYATPHGRQFTEGQPCSTPGTQGAVISEETQYRIVAMGPDGTILDAGFATNPTVHVVDDSLAVCRFAFTLELDPSVAAWRFVATEGLEIDPLLSITVVTPEEVQLATADPFGFTIPVSVRVDVGS